MMVGSHDELQAETGYIDARPHQPSRRKLLQRTGHSRRMDRPDDLAACPLYLQQLPTSLSRRSDRAVSAASIWLGAFRPLDGRPSGCQIRRQRGRLRAPPFRQSANPARKWRETSGSRRRRSRIAATRRAHSLPAGVSEHGESVGFDMLVEPQARTGLGQDRGEWHCSPPAGRDGGRRRRARSGRRRRGTRWRRTGSSGVVAAHRLAVDNAEGNAGGRAPPRVPEGCFRPAARGTCIGSRRRGRAFTAGDLRRAFFSDEAASDIAVPACECCTSRRSPPRPRPWLCRADWVLCRQGDQQALPAMASLWQRADMQ